MPFRMTHPSLTHSQWVSARTLTRSYTHTHTHRALSLDEKNQRRISRRKKKMRENKIIPRTEAIIIYYIYHVPSRAENRDWGMEKHHWSHRMYENPQRRFRVNCTVQAESYQKDRERATPLLFRFHIHKSPNLSSTPSIPISFYYDKRDVIFWLI